MQNIMKKITILILVIITFTFANINTVVAASTKYYFPIENYSRKTISCSSYVQQVLYKTGYSQLKGSQKIWARTNSSLSKSDFTKNNIPVKIINDVNQARPGDLIQWTSMYHMEIVYTTSSSTITVKGIRGTSSAQAGAPSLTYKKSALKSCYLVRLTDLK